MYKRVLTPRRWDDSFIEIFTGIILNDNEAFLRKAEAIVDDVYPISTYSYPSNYEVTQYKMEIADYRLSLRCHEIRDDLEGALSACASASSTIGSPYTTYKMKSIVIDASNLLLESVRDEIRVLRD